MSPDHSNGEPSARPARSASLNLPALIWLTLVWVALWGEVSAFNALAGLVVAVAVCLVFPFPRLQMDVRVRSCAWAGSSFASWWMSWSPARKSRGRRCSSAVSRSMR